MKAHKQSNLFRWQKVAKNGGVCEKCGRQVPTLTVDHIIPTSIADVLDETGEWNVMEEDNFQLICHPCNKFKAARLDKTNQKTKELLLRLFGDKE